LPQAPSELERRDILKTLTAPLPLLPDVAIPALAIRTAALVPVHLIDLCIRAESAAQDRYEKYSSSTNIDMSDLELSGVGINMADFDQALSEVRGNFSDSIGAPKIPNVGWDDVGGLVDVKNDILDTIQLPLEHPELFAKGMKKRSGQILLFFAYIRYSAVWAAWNREDITRQSSRHLILPQLLLSKGPRTTEHVHRRIRSQCPSRIPTCS
jgi:peroxin-6